MADERAYTALHAVLVRRACDYGLSQADGEDAASTAILALEEAFTKAIRGRRREMHAHVALPRTLDDCAPAPLGEVPTKIGALLSRIPILDRPIIEMWLGGMTQAQVARAVGLSVGAIQKRFRRLRLAGHQLGWPQGRSGRRPRRFARTQAQRQAQDELAASYPYRPTIPEA